jgi:surface polysaccharide O-acyltransferase-like enzyme
MQNNNRQVWLDNIKTLAILAVVFSHVAEPVRQQFGNINIAVWWLVNVSVSFTRFCVPVFVMVTGTLLLPRQYELFDFLKRRLSRIAIPFVFWTVAYIGYDLITKYLNHEPAEVLKTIKWIARRIADGSADHLWYIYMLIGIYLLIPVIGKWIRDCQEKEILYFLAIWVYVLIIKQPWINRWEIQIDLHFFIGYVGYLVLGYYLAQKNLFDRSGNVFPVLMFIAGGAATAIGSYAVTDFFQRFLTPNVLLMSTGVFLFLKNREIHGGEILNRTREFFAKYSLGIYLVHILILRLLDKAGVNYGFINLAVGIPLTTVLCLAISGVAMYGIDKLPYGQYISGTGGSGTRVVKIRAEVPEAK